MSDKTQLERVTKLITEYGNATFDCGEWQSEADGDYDGLLKIAYSKRVEIAQQILDICQPQWIPVSERWPDIKPPRNIDIAYQDATDGIFTAKISSRLIPHLHFYAWREVMEPFQPPPPPEDTA